MLLGAGAVILIRALSALPLESAQSPRLNSSRPSCWKGGLLFIYRSSMFILPIWAFTRRFSRTAQ